MKDFFVTGNKFCLAKEKGITLIALVITIIILLILAGITIVQLTETGLFGKAELANQKTRYATAKEVVDLKLLEIQTDCAMKNEDYTLIKIAKEMEDSKEITVQNYRFENTASIKQGLTVISEALKEQKILKEIEVSVDKYPEYIFLIGQTCQIEKVSIDGKYDDWEKLLEFAEIDKDKYENFEQAVQDKDVIKAITTSKEAMDYLKNSPELFEIFMANSDVIQDLPKQELELEKNESVENEPYYTFLAKAGKTYLIECWGGQGGHYSSSLQGGYGGYSYGIYKPTEDTLLYIYIGGAGVGHIANGTANGGYNGGGALNKTWGDSNERRATGGGATHIATVPGLLSTLEEYKEKILIVAGGGGRISRKC